MHLTLFWALEDNVTVIKTDLLCGTYSTTGVKDNVQLHKSTHVW